MKRRSTFIVAVGLTALSACGALGNRDTVSSDRVGAGFGAITPAILSERRDWNIVADMSGAPPGEIVARNDARGFCAYARGDATFYTAPCP